MTRANDAKTKTEQAEEDELRKLTIAEAGTHLEEHEYTDISGEKITIPAGFAVSQVEGENTVAEGLVIIDKSGNEFVWVPVNQENFATEFVRREGYRNKELQALVSDCGEANAEGINVKIEESNITKEESKKLYQSIYTNEGFYIGRYETGKDNNGNVVVQKDVNVYNNVPWSKNGQMDETSEEVSDKIEETKEGAVELARAFARKNEYRTVTSTLCYSVQWDAVMSWIDPEYKTGNCDINTSFVANSTGRGNYNEDINTNEWKGNIALTGASKNYKVNNIYDLAGNVYEWTMESFFTVNRIIRGGYYENSDCSGPASCRGSNYPYTNSPNVGFRIALYIL